MQRTLLALLVAFTLVLAACAGSEDGATQQADDTMTEQPSSTIEDTASAETPSTTSPTTTEGDSDGASGGAEDAPATTNPPPEGPAAPDFTLALGPDGAESFTLSQEVKPVFMVFWAEW